MSHIFSRTNPGGLIASLAGLSLGVTLACGSDIVAVPLGDRVEVFEVDNAKAKNAAAGRLDVRTSDILNGRLRAAIPRPAMLGAAWKLSDRVLVRASDRRLISKAAGLGLTRVMPIALSKGWYSIETGSIENAAALASKLRRLPGVRSAEVDVTPPFDLREIPNDALFGDQWHLLNMSDPGIDVRASEAWALGYTGLGVTIGIIESGGFKNDHEDLAPMFNAAISQPTTFTSSHMTQVAGVAAGFGNNGVGVAGAAYNAALAQRLIGSNFATASALTSFNDSIDIKNNSWGPSDDGRFDFPSNLILNAIETAANTGRAGLGEIIVWAGGNGNGSSDRVDYDPYASSRYTISVGAVGDDNVVADYSEPGASLLICAYSNGGSRGITTTQSNGGYTSNFGGTSAASPLAAGVVALMLDANPDLSWRDVQHILVDTSRVVAAADEGWIINGSGRLVNEFYGYGLIDALAAVTLAEDWEPVSQEISGSSGVVQVNMSVPDNSASGISIDVPVDDTVRIESVEVVLSVQAGAVGDLDIRLVSPDGTASQLSRSRIDPQDNFVNTVFTSVRHWGERSDGIWNIRIADQREFNDTFWQSVEIRVHGTDAGPGPCATADMAEPFGILDLADTLVFVVAFQTEDASADFAAPFGVFDEKDIGAFVTTFINGCE